MGIKYTERHKKATEKYMKKTIEDFKKDTSYSYFLKIKGYRFSIVENNSMNQNAKYSLYVFGKTLATRASLQRCIDKVNEYIGEK